MAAALKDQGNEEFNKGNFLKAASLYTQAIKQDGQNAALHSNLSAALLKLKKVTKALEAAEECIKLKPDWEKGYHRKGAVYEELQQYDKALEVYHHAQSLFPDSKELGQKIRSLAKLVKITERHQNEDTWENFLSKAFGQSALTQLCEAVMGEVSSSLSEDGLAFVPSLHFLQGPKAEAHEEAQRHVRATLAFAQPDMLLQFVQEMRDLAGKLDAEAVCMVASKPTIAYPQVWNKAGWPCGKTPGVFVQVETKTKTHCWFVPVHEKVPGKPRALSDDFCPLQHKLLKA